MRITETAKITNKESRLFLTGRACFSACFCSDRQKGKCRIEKK